MRNVGLTFIAFFLCAGLYAQHRVDDFYSLMTVAPSNKSIVESIVKNDDGIKVEVSNYQPTKNLKKTYKSISKKIDELSIIDYKADTIYVLEVFDGVRPFTPSIMLKSTKDTVRVGIKTPLSEGIIVSKNFFNPILTNPFFYWNKESILRIIEQYGSKPDEMEGPVWESATRLIIKDNRLITRDVFYFDALMSGLFVQY